MVYLGHFSPPPPPVYKREASFNCVSCGAPVIHQDCDYCGRAYEVDIIQPVLDYIEEGFFIHAIGSIAL